MSQQSCSACNDLREYAPEFVLNGATDNVGEHLKNDDGLSAADGHTDCEDLLDVNDCLIGNLIDELDAYDVCDWKEFMAAALGNMYETLKSIIYSECGQWCSINGLYNGTTFHFSEATTGDAYAVAGKGVSFLIPHQGQQNTTDINLTHIAGGLLRGSGSYHFYSSSFTDAGACMNFDNGDTAVSSQSRSGNTLWGTFTNTLPATIPSGGELICEFRLKKSAFPQVRSIHDGFGTAQNNGQYTVRAVTFNEGSYAYGQHGGCNTSTGAPSTSGMNRGHLVPAGWLYIQLRLSQATDFSANEQFSPLFFMGIRMNADEMSC